MEAKTGRRWLMIYALMFIGWVLLIGGWTFDRAGNPDNMFPWWIPVLGIFVMFGTLPLAYQQVDRIDKKKRVWEGNAPPRKTILEVSLRLDY